MKRVYQVVALSLAIACISGCTSKTGNVESSPEVTQNVNVQKEQKKCRPQRQWKKVC